MTAAIKVGESLMVSARPAGRVRVCVRHDRLFQFHTAACISHVPDWIVANARNAIDRGSVLVIDLDAVYAIAISQYSTGALSSALLTQANASLDDKENEA